MTCSICDLLNRQHQEKLFFWRVFSFCCQHIGEHSKPDRTHLHLLVHPCLQFHKIRCRSSDEAASLVGLRDPFVIYQPHPVRSDQRYFPTIPGS